jgi:hypothetical protein
MNDSRGGVQGTPALLILAENASQDALRLALALGRTYKQQSGARLEFFGDTRALERIQGEELDARHGLVADNPGARIWLALGQSLAAGQAPLLLRAPYQGITLAHLQRMRELAPNHAAVFLTTPDGAYAAVTLARAMPELFALPDINQVMSATRLRSRRRGWDLGEIKVAATR